MPNPRQILIAALATLWAASPIQVHSQFMGPVSPTITERLDRVHIIPVADDEEVARLRLRIRELEEHIRLLTGKVDELEYELSRRSPAGSEPALIPLLCVHG